MVTVTGRKRARPKADAPQAWFYRPDYAEEGEVLLVFINNGGNSTRRIYEMHTGRQFGDVLMREGNYRQAFPEDLSEPLFASMAIGTKKRWTSGDPRYPRMFSICCTKICWPSGASIRRAHKHSASAAEQPAARPLNCSRVVSPDPRFRDDFGRAIASDSTSQLQSEQSRAVDIAGRTEGLCNRKGGSIRAFCLPSARVRDVDELHDSTEQRPDSRPSESAMFSTSLQRRKLIVCLLLVLATLALYSSATRAPFLNYDDQVYVTVNPQVRAGLTWNTVVWAFRTPESLELAPDYVALLCTR